MKKEVEVSVFETVGSRSCVASSDGQKVYDRLSKILKKGLSARVSFRNVKDLNTAFLNSAIGQLYGDFKEEEIRGSINIEDMDEAKRERLSRVKIGAKRFYQDREKSRQALEYVMDE